jgi:hypothetical protein
MEGAAGEKRRRRKEVREQMAHSFVSLKEFKHYNTLPPPTNSW